MAGHGDREHVTARIDARIDLFQCLRGSGCLFGSASETVLEVEKRLAHGIGKGNGSVVDERNFPDSPALLKAILSVFAEGLPRSFVTHLPRGSARRSYQGFRLQGAGILCF